MSKVKWMSIKKNLNRIVYAVFGMPLSQNIWNALFGYYWRGWFLGIIRYRAVYMVNRGETVILGGVFSESYVEDYSNRVGSNGKVIVVEANPVNILRLRERFKNINNILFINRAIWNKEKTLTLLAADQDVCQGYNRVKSENIDEFPNHLVQDINEISVSACTLDTVMQTLNRDKVDQINLTINGAELPALDGFKSILRNNNKLRFYINSQYPEPITSVIRRLKELGFRVFKSNLISTTNKKIKLVRIYAFASGNKK